MTSVSIIVPLHNEALSLGELASELCQTAANHNWEFEIIFIDDGSSDGSWQGICELSRADQRIKGFRLAKNYGKSAALFAGFHSAKYQTIVMIDADLQDVPGEIPKLLGQLEAGYDLVTGWKTRRQDTRSKRLTSSGYNWLVNRLCGMQLHDHNCGLKAMKASVATRLPLRRGMHRFITVFAHRLGFRVGEVPVVHRARRYGSSNYGLLRFPVGLFDLLRVSLMGKAILAQMPDLASIQIIERAGLD